MDFTLRQLRAFATIARLRSFTRAADVLHTTQPALSAQIRELEASLGVRLFDRNTRSVAPTRAGADLLPVVDQVLSALDSVAARVKLRRRAMVANARSCRSVKSISVGNNCDTYYSFVLWLSLIHI